MANDKIFVYSGTGNCYATAKQIAAELDMEIIHITEELTQSYPVATCRICVIVFPVYAFGIPMGLRRFIQNATIDVEYLAVITTKGSYQWGALAECVRLFRKRGRRVQYTNAIRAVENFVHMFKLPEPDQIMQTCARQNQLTNSIINDIKHRKTNNRFTFRPESSCVSFVFRRVTPMFARRYRIDENCNGCRVCYRVCPPHAIEMVDGKPKIHPKKCDHCQSCMQLCPRRAISFGKINPDSRRYIHPDVTLPELYKRD